jgi:large subunit ribosomal protein L3
MAWIIAKKLEMTRIIKGDRFIPITLLQIPELRVVWMKTKEKDWYIALIVGMQKEEKELVIKEGKTTLSKNEFEEIGEFPINEWDEIKFNIGDKIGIDVLDWVEKVEIEGLSKWKWFAGAMKRWNFAGGPWRVWSKFHRALGSIGNRKPRRTHKGKKMHGHMGNEKVSLKNIPLELVNKEISVIWVRGGVPWGRNSFVNIIF